MNTYAIRRRQAWQSPQEVEWVAARSKDVADLVVIRPDPDRAPAAA